MCFFNLIYFIFVFQHCVCTSRHLTLHKVEKTNTCVLCEIIHVECKLACRTSVYIYLFNFIEI